MADAEPLVDTLETHIENTREQNAEAVGFLMRWNFLNQALIPNAPSEDDEDVPEDAPEVHPLQEKMVELANETNYLLRKSVLVNDGVGFPQFDFITRDEDYDTMRDRAILLNTTMEEILGDFDIQGVSSLFFLREEAFEEKTDEDDSDDSDGDGLWDNDELLYSGRYDIKGKFEGIPAIMDCKSGAFDMRQLAAYAVCEEGIKRLVVLPIGPTDNKCGYKKPVVCDAIKDEFKGFQRARAKFQLRFGI